MKSKDLVTTAIIFSLLIFYKNVHCQTDKNGVYTGKGNALPVTNGGAYTGAPSNGLATGNNNGGVSGGINATSGSSSADAFPPVIGLISIDSATPLIAPPTGYLVYNYNMAGISPENVVPGYYYNGGTTEAPFWKLLIAGNTTSGGWQLTGNAGMKEIANFLGTTDSVSLNFRVNNQRAGRIEWDNLSGNTYYGLQSGWVSKAGTYNTGIGYMALSMNSEGKENTGAGAYVLSNNIKGKANSGFGFNSLSANVNGSYNTAFGDSSLISVTNGNYNTALGFHADAAGKDVYNATAIGYKAIVKESNTMEFGNTLVKGWGFGGALPLIGKNSVGKIFIVGTDATNGNGAYLSAGGVWTNTSDSNKKENFSSVNSQEILHAVCNMNIMRWNYKGEAPIIQHIGPVAQDFYRVFHLGNDSLSISTIDPSGIALVSIKALNVKLEQQNKEITNRLNEQDKEIALLKLKLNQLLQGQMASK